ncbi:MAG: helix-turn-helix domain-containing protein [Saprospiraceae bacterium]
MNTNAFAPQHPPLAGLIEYFFFNEGTNQQLASVQTSYANANICLGVLQNATLDFSPTAVHQFTKCTGVQSYLTGLYLPPHRVQLNTVFTEICINFTPRGYYYFFDIPLSEAAAQTDILRAAFGQEGVFAFEQILIESCRKTQLFLLENFFLQHLKSPQSIDLQQIETLLSHHKNALSSVAELSLSTQLHLKKLYRLCKYYLGVSPKEYLQIARFRRTLNRLESRTEYSLTEIAYQMGYYDQSHFIKEIRGFTGQRPRHLVRNLLNVNDLLVLKIDND